jgi:flagellar protein FlbD
MIELTRLNTKTIFINPDLIQSIEETPDTLISLSNGDHYLVREKAAELIEKIVDFRVTILRRAEKPGELCRPAPCIIEK